MNTSGNGYHGILIFLSSTFAISSIFWVLIIFYGLKNSLVTGLLWSPGVAALLTCKLTGQNLSGLGWKWGKARYQLQSYLLPLGYVFIAYLVVWITGLGSFPDGDFLDKVVAAFGWEGMSEAFVILFYVLLFSTTGLIEEVALALGEEIGWRGYLVPKLGQFASFTKVSLVSGLIWAIWHYPIIMLSEYNSGTDVIYSLVFFTVQIVGFSFAMTWLRFKSGSLWTATLFHASHNLFIQRIFTPLTEDTGFTAYFVDEFGAALAIVAVFVAFFFWNKAQVEQACHHANPI